MQIKLKCGVCGHTLGKFCVSGQEQTLEVHPCWNCMTEIWWKASSIVKKRAEKRSKNHK